MAENIKKPAIRFAGFTEAWEQRKVNEICYISTGRSNTQDKIDDGKYPFYVRSPIIERSNRYLYDEEAVLTVGDGVGTGKVFHYVNGKYDIHQRVYRLFGFSDDVDAKFFYHWFSENFYNRVMSMTAKTSVDSVRLEMIADMEMTAPPYDEQKKISSYLDHLDHLITLHQRKYDKFTNAKKSMLEKMFPKNGSNVPEIRFKGFTEAWEQRKLEEVSSEMVAGGDINKDLILDEGRYPVIANAITNNGIVGYYNEDYRIKSPAVTVTGRGDVGHAKARIIDFTPVVRLLTIKSNHDVFFLENSINTLKIVVESTGVPQLTVPQLAKYDIYFPESLDEEKKIGTFFRNLDNLITLHQRKLEKLKNIKKSMLEKMFI